MSYKKYFFIFLFSISTNVYACDNSNFFEKELGLRHRKGIGQYEQVPIKESEIIPNSNPKSLNATYENVFQSKALEEFVKFCTKNMINCNLQVILNDLGSGSESLEDYNRKAPHYKKFLTHYHVSKDLLDDLYKDLVRMILEQRKDQGINVTTEETTDSE